MKKRYFSEENLSAESQRMLQRARQVRSWPRANFDPNRSALLILDMQDYFLDESSHAYVPSAPTILPGIQALLHAYSLRELPVVFTRHINTPQDAGMMAKWWRDMILPESPLSRITRELDISEGQVFNKNQYDAFHGTGLEDYLRSKGVDQLVICGVMTHLCCETTARSAFIRGFEVLFPVNGTATYRQDFHQAALLNLCHGFAWLLLVEDLLQLMGGDRD